ncbi:beta-N-acetylhexosaminidase [Rufibacter latericius]|uniref:beta-N-acetylhexosaminidase n=1 Tax=Rufibacter latericius TaxID=2487040 RepID=A0A3M9MT36_9BACT|nr:beta-N-acetylhexosaminidase [Rufibacter latericius]RNI28649.1 beta-N-acetylhexosaminidase [Rufibacter latericius]
MKKWWLSFLSGIFALVSFHCLGQAGAVNNIVPKPVSFTATGERPVLLNKHTVILADAPYKAQAEYLQGLLLDQCDLGLAIGKPDAKPGKHSKIQLMHDTIEANRPEMYWLESGGPVIRIKARDVAGMVHGIQTLLQLLPLGKTKEVPFPTVEIKDFPRFAYRGMHLDVSRHIFPVSFLKKYLDYLAFHKFNTFHWHLTDDQGWRLEIKSYPKLTQVGAWRNSTLIGHFKDVPARYDSTRYGGFYTQDQVREIIQYAAVRGINVIPEIDIPGHSRAIIASYPEFSTKPDSAWQVANTWGMYNRQNNVLAPNAATFQFLETVFQEVADLFPSEYIHIGGDECSKIWWKASPSTQAFMKANGLKDEKELQTYFIQQVAGYLAKKNKKVIGWHEILEGELDTTAVIMNWGGAKEGIAAAQRRHPVIMAPGKPLYFDNYQSKDPKDSLAIHGYNPLDAVYQYNPVPQELQQLRLEKYILGAQANVWTEYMETPAKVEYMVFPRMTALSEVLWTDPRQKDFADFKRRLKTTILPRYSFWGSAYFKDFERWTLAEK